MRILFVCFADSTHSQSWISLLKDTEFEVRVFASPVEYDLFPSQRWQFPTYALIQPNGCRPRNQVLWLLPRIDCFQKLTKAVSRKFRLDSRWLRRIISTWKPDLIHTLRLIPEGELTWQALRRIPKERRPKWVVSAWGRELDAEIDDPGIREQIHSILQFCDGFLADCRRDIRLALAAGLEASKIGLNDAVPVSGGLDLNRFVTMQSNHKNRNLIVIPRAYEGPHNKTLVILEALCLAEDALNGFEIHLLICSNEVRFYLRRMPETIRRRCHYHEGLPQEKLFAMLGRARVMIATSLADGTPNVMLEAMAAGALPIMSPLEPIKEWIENGINGLLAHALYPDQIADALRRALTDDELFHQAQTINYKLVKKRANRGIIREQVLRYYRSLVSTSATKVTSTV